MLTSCKKCPPPSAFPPLYYFYFSIVDNEGNDLFFGKDSIYNPRDVQIAYIPSRGLPEGKKLEDELIKISVSELNSCFEVMLFLGSHDVLIYLKLFSERLDTIRTAYRVIGHYEEPKGCRHHDYYEYDVYFNGKPICFSCPDPSGIYNRLIYKIVLE